MAKRKAKAARTAKTEASNETKEATAISSIVDATAQTLKVSSDKTEIQKAVKEGLAVLKEGKSKAEAAWAIYEKLKNEDKETIVSAFVKGATLTEKGALTYWYNCRRREKKAAKRV